METDVCRSPCTWLTRGGWFEAIGTRKVSRCAFPLVTLFRACAWTGGCLHISEYTAVHPGSQGRAGSTGQA